MESWTSKRVSSLARFSITRLTRPAFDQALTTLCFPNLRLHALSMKTSRSQWQTLMHSKCKHILHAQLKSATHNELTVLRSLNWDSFGSWGSPRSTGGRAFVLCKVGDSTHKNPTYISHLQGWWRIAQLHCTGSCQCHSYDSTSDQTAWQDANTITKSRYASIQTHMT